MRVAFATCAAFPDGFDDDHEAAKLLGAEFRVWSDRAVDWAAYDRVIIRSTWDYSTRRDEFVAWAHRVGAERLRNPPALVAVNSDKRYLASLAVPAIPTTFVAPGDPAPELDGEVVVKPTFSAGARDTGRFGPALHDDALALVRTINDSGRTAMVQPYLAGVDEAGETASVFIGGELSHVLHKKAVLRPDEIAPLAESLPPADPSRDAPESFPPAAPSPSAPESFPPAAPSPSAPELDADIAPAAAMLDPDLVTPSTADEAQKALAAKVAAQLTDDFGPLPYLRVDMVPGPDGAPVVIEIEAIEPCLYLDLVPGAAHRFAEAVRRS